MNKKYMSFFFIIFLLFGFMKNVEAADDVGLTFTYPLNFYSLYDVINLNKELKDNYEKFKIEMNDYCSKKYGNDYVYFIYKLNPNLDFYEKHEERGSFNGVCFADKKTEKSGIVNFDKFSNRIEGEIYFETTGKYTYYYGYSKGLTTFYPEERTDSWYSYDFTLFLDSDPKINMYIDSNHTDYRITSVPLIWHSYYPNNFTYFNSFNINGVNYVPNDYIIKDLVSTLPIKMPKLQIKELKHDEFDGKYSSKTYEYSFDIYDKTKYRYYYSNDKVNFKEFTKNSFKVRYHMNMILYFKITDISGKEIVTYFHEINDIAHKITDESLNHTGTGMPDYGYQSSDDPLDENSTVSDILGWFTDLFKKKLGIIFQIKEIYDSWLSYDNLYDHVCLWPDDMDGYGVTTGDLDEAFRTPCDRIPMLNLKPFGIDKKVNVINFDVFMDYQDEYFFWLKLSLSMITLYKVIKNVRYAFGGGK